MLSPLDPATLSNNPKFNVLYEDLCANKLNPDGTSKIHDAKTLKDREVFAEDLRKARIEVARRDLVVAGLKHLSHHGNDLPEDLRELVVVIAAVLEGQVADEDRDLLQDDVAKFKSNIKPIATALSKQFERNAEILAVIVNPDDPPSIENMPSSISETKDSITSAETGLATSRLQLSTEASKLHASNRDAIRRSIAILEQAIHGSVARGSKAKADYLATVAEGMSKKLALQQSQLTSQMYPPEMRAALKARAEGLEQQVRATKRKVREAEERLEGYRRVGGMKGVAQEYAEVLAEQKRVRGEIERVQGER